MAIVYHWKHGWIPLDHTAALSKAKGSHEHAARLLQAARDGETGIKTKQHLKGAIEDMHNVPDSHRAEAAQQIKQAAPEHGVHLPGTEPVEKTRTADLLAEVKAFDDNPPSPRTTPSAEYRKRVTRYNAAKHELGLRQIPAARSGGTAGGGYNEARG